MRSEQTEQLKSTPPCTDKYNLPNKILRAYTLPSKQHVTDEQINELLPMVPRIAQNVISYLPNTLTFEDLTAAGTLGLVQAARNYKPGHNTEFKTYAFIRIRGAILDELKKWNFIPASMSKKIGEAFNLARQIMEETGHPPDDEQLAKALGTTIDDVRHIQKSARTHQFLSIDDESIENSGLAGILKTTVDAPEKRIENQELIDSLAQAIQSLPKRKRQLILLYYQQELTMKEIAEVLEITESRVSQMHASALFDLSVKLKEFKDGED